MLQTVKLKHFLNKWKVSSNLDIFVLFCLCSPEPKVQAPVDFTLTIFTCTFYFIFFSPAPLCQYSIQTWLKTYWCEGALRVFFSKWRICTPIREIQCKNNEKDEILYYVNCPFSYDKKNLPWFWLFSNDRK